MEFVEHDYRATLFLIWALAAGRWDGTPLRVPSCMWSGL